MSRTRLTHVVETSVALRPVSDPIAPDVYRTARARPPLGSKVERSRFSSFAASRLRRRHLRSTAHPAATAATRKRILRAALHEIVVVHRRQPHPDDPALVGW